MMGAAVALWFTSLSALAFEGFSVGIIGNDATFDSQGTEEEGRADRTVYLTELNSTKVSEEAEFPSLFAEYTWGSDGIFAGTVGVEFIPGEHSIGNKIRTDTKDSYCTAGETGCSTETFSASGEVSNIMTAYIEPTMMFNDHLGVYAKGGVSHMDLKITETASNAIYPDAKLWGMMYGLGMKAVIGPGLLVKLEGLMTEYRDLDMTANNGNNNRVEASTERQAVRLAIGWNF